METRKSTTSGSGQQQRRPAAAPRSQAPRSGAPRPASGSRPAGSRPAGTRPAGNRPAGSTTRPRTANGSRSAAASRPGGHRPPTGPRRPSHRRRGPNPLIPALAVVVLVAVILAVWHPWSRKPAPRDPQTVSATPAADTGTAGIEATTEPSGNHSDSLAEMLGSEDEIVGRKAEELVQVEDLAINESLPTDEWINVLLLGSDERVPGQSTRTDSMIICSVNTKTGAVKLASIMRDTAVTFPEVGGGKDFYRVNAANYFGGERLAIRTVNRMLGMNIQYYVRVNFFGFQEVAQLVGGIDLDITENEKNEINNRVWEVHKLAVRSGIDDSKLPLERLEQYGENVHLDGRQALAYARIRKLDSDYARTDRQRKVLVALLEKVRGANMTTLLSLVGTALPYVYTNLDGSAILSIAPTVTGSDLSNVETLRLPLQGTYVQDTRGGQDMLYDTDWTRNSNELRAFIYG